MSSAKLTHEQKEIVEFYGSPLRVLAGPGTGKTLCLVEKVNFLIKTRKITPSEITLVTFTRAAAGELRGRIGRSGIGPDKIPYVNTLHGFAVNILRKYQSKAKLKPGFQPIGSDFTKLLIKDVFQELKQNNIYLSYSDIKSFTNAHFQLKAKAGVPKEMNNNDRHKKILNRFSSSFHEHLEFYNALDWSDFLYKTIELIELYPEIREEIHKGTKYLLVDEYQDLSPLEQYFIEKINADGSGLCIVGDDDQSIYETFRFANPGGLINFHKKYPACKSLFMSICWRCPPDVIKVALAVVKNNKNRIKKELKPLKEEKKGYVVCISHKSKKEEISWLVSKILEIQKKRKEIKHEDIMVLFKDGKIAKDYVSELQKSNIPLDLQLKVSNIFETEQFLGLLSAVKFLVNPHDNLNLRYCLYSWKGIGLETVRQIRLLSISMKKNLWDVIKDIISNPRLFKAIKNRNSVKKFHDFYKELICAKKFTKILQIYFERFLESKVDKACSIFLENLERFEGKEGFVSLKEILEDFENKMESGELESKYKEKGEGVRIMTMHSAKGCESPVVIIPTLEDDVIPGVTKNLEEQRRLFYVSLTRSQFGLYLSWARQRSGQEIHTVEGRKMLSKQKSRFLDEMGGLI